MGEKDKKYLSFFVVLTSGGICEDKKEWMEMGYLPFEIIHKKWRYHLLNMIKEQIPTEYMKRMIDELYKLYPKGFVANVIKGEAPEKAKGLAVYLAKYMASPPISVRRILTYDGKRVTYWYNDHETYYKFRCTRCKFENEMNEANVDVAYGWTKKRTRTSDGEIVPVLECPNCSKWTYECID